MKTVEVQLYPYNELSEEAKENAYQKWLQDIDTEWVSDAIDSMKSAMKAFGCIIKDYNIDHLYDKNNYVKYLVDNMFENGGFEYGSQVPIKGLRLRTYILNNFYDSLYTKKFYSKYIEGSVSGKRFNVRESNIVYVESSCAFEGFYMDDVFLEPVREFLAKPDKDVTFRKLIDKCLKRVFKSITEEYEYRTTKEYFAEEAAENDYEFLSNGNTFNPRGT